MRLASLASVAFRLFGELIAPSGCAACDSPVRARVLFCPACAATVERLPSTEGSIAMFEYGGAIATAIASLKYRDRPDLGPRLGEAIVPAARPLRGHIDVVVPVPLHPRRLAERGYNQALLLATPIARALGVPLAPGVLVRVRDTSQQATLDRAGRLANITGSFAVRASARGARVLLVDDVRTTGATVAACRRVLGESGAVRVYDLVVAHRV